MHEMFMKLAIEEAKKGQGKTYTNPLVGSVIVSGNEVISQGAHLEFGQAHAEKNAIDLCKTPEKLFNSTLYVTLEPCDHYGKQPPCTAIISNSGIKCVVIGQLDPNPLVSGKGVEKLREQGIQVITGILEKEVRSLNEHYNYFFERQMPFVTLKQAMSADGKISFARRRTQLTQEAASKRVHEERGSYQSILVGSETILTDNPNLLSTNKSPFPPVRIVLDRRGRVLVHPQFNIFKDKTAPVLIFTEAVVNTEQLPGHVEVVSLSKVTIPAVLHALQERTIQSVYVEGGAIIHDAFLASDCWEEIICYMTPTLLGGNSLPAMSSNRETSHLASMKFTEIEKIGEDFRIVGRRE
ncbi:bifunctional diaminohydroxyphosphoribosylaminopyrimidine deaminase/5-amino-6-(5-phosphoribosylamino)uracil reductase RibD [Enterococcus sp. CWB-B31]|uniref:bifunctional diaminohydroxyphosphoribosylaminopyrimidine deaminase/5-amino-6-(5-phosphoribosylamino)uracil reductase RibD n=1 Tax=unclassified Enterococcus TaxID=2608891 RepID=UPI003B639B01